MYVGVMHRISDPAGFQAAEDKALKQGLPAHVQLPIHAATPDHSTGICIWQGESADAVRALVESVVGPFGKNEYLELEVHGLPEAAQEAKIPTTTESPGSPAALVGAWTSLEHHNEGKPGQRP